MISESCCIHSSDQLDTNEEYKEAIRRNIPVMKRATLLGQMMHNYQNAIRRIWNSR